MSVLRRPNHVLDLCAHQGLPALSAGLRAQDLPSRPRPVLANLYDDKTVTSGVAAKKVALGAAFIVRGRDGAHVLELIYAKGQVEPGALWFVFHNTGHSERRQQFPGTYRGPA